MRDLLKKNINKYNTYDVCERLAYYATNPLANINSNEDEDKVISLSKRACELLKEQASSLNNRTKFTFNGKGLVIFIHHLAKIYKACQKDYFLFSSKLRDSFEQVFEQFLLIAADKLNELNSQELANMLHALGILNFKLKPEFITLWKDVVVYRIEEFNAQDLSNSLYAFSLLRIKPEGHFLELIKQAIIKKLSSFNPQDLANMMYSFGVLGIEPGKGFLANIKQEVVTELKKFKAQDFGNIIYALALLRATFNIEEELIIILVNALNTMKEYNLTDRSQIHLALQVVSPEGFQRIKDNIRKMVAGWKASLEEYARSRTTTSNLQKSIALSLKDLGEDIREEEYISELAACVDIYIPERNLVIQVDGPYHYFSDSKELDTPTKLNTYLAKKAGYNVMRISYENWEKLTNGERKTYLTNHVCQVKPSENTIELINPIIHIKTESIYYLSDDLENSKKLINLSGKTSVPLHNGAEYNRKSSFSCLAEKVEKACVFNQLFDKNTCVVSHEINSGSRSK